ncbi:TIGR01458 family HAD-type hydrolase [Hydrogenimonas sp.]|uniref:TIGR01458 family HAD-type hydrolase n=1 Tax=Hydrogenimonas sp. TaxID=2231112 RepID=UPI0026399CCC|nr:TIGR01458 family HAD-type hydrolase [Hydrogenimonas sp.]
MNGIQALLLDLSGVLYEGDNMVEGALEAVEVLKKRYPVRFITNTTRKTGRQVCEKLRKMGFDIDEKAIFTALDATKRFLDERDARGYFLLFHNVEGEFSDYTSENPDYVFVADAYTDFTYEKLNTAFRHLMEGAELVAIAKNRYFKDSDGMLSLDAGGFVTLLEYASGKKAQIIGKPAKTFFHAAAVSMGVDPAHVMMVGDDIESDILGAQKAGMQTCFVRTGKFRPEDLQRGIEPGFVIDSIADLPTCLKMEQGGIIVVKKEVSCGSSIQAEHSTNGTIP